MNFVSTRVLWAIPIVLPGVIWFLWWSWRKRQALMRLFVSERLLPQLLEGYSPRRQKIKLALLALAALFLMLALARPQWGFVWEEANQRGRDILVAIDTSRSMLAEDMAPNRLARAKLAALDLMRLSKSDRLGLIAFAGGAFLQCPLTLDEEAFRQNVNALDTSIIPQGGTAMTEAIEAAMTTFAAEEGDNHKVLVIFTDGEDHERGVVDMAQNAADRNLKIFTVGVGTPSGELLKITDENGNSSFIKDDQGNVVKSRLNEDLLRQIATIGNGFYLALREGNAMQALYQRGLEPLPTTELSSKLVRNMKEQFHWPLGVAIALLLTEILLPPAPKKRAAANAGQTARAAALAVAILLLNGVVAEASPARAYRDYQAGQYKDARNEYERLLEKKPDDPRLNFNAGAASFKAGAYDAAAKQFSNAARAEDLKLQEMAYYNLGNANYKLGDEEADPTKKMALWHEAVQNFESSLKLNPKDADAAFNRDWVKKKLEELKKQQQQQNNDKNDNKDQNKEDQKQDQQQDQKDNKQDQKDQQQQNKDNQDSKSDQQKQDEQKTQQQEQQQQDEKQKQQEQQQQEKQQGNEGEDKQDAQRQGDKDQAKQGKESKEKGEAEREARAAQLGQMTPRQAQQMLDAQKSDEKALIYRQLMDEKKSSRNRMFKDW